MLVIGAVDATKLEPAIQDKTYPSMLIKVS